MEADLLDIGGWIVGQLDSIAGLNGAWLGRIPASVKLPAARFQLMAPRDVRVVDGVIVITVVDMLVAAVAEGGVDELRAPAKALHAALHLQTGTAGDVDVLSCVRISPFTMTEISEGRTYHHAGGVYRIVAVGN